MFLASERIGKYILSIFVCVGLLSAFGVLNQGLISDVISIAIGFLVSNLLLGLMKVILGNFEDAVKVTGDTEKLLTIYPGTKKTVTYNGTEGYVAYSEVIVNEGYKFSVQDDENSVYTLPDFVGDNFVDLFVAHARSTKRNFVTIRLDGFEKTGANEYAIRTGRSTYYNHLLTNRACDYRIEDDLTLRDLYEFGPKISPIEQSVMSNHIGVNGLVYLSDGELLIPRRKNDSTISKNMITSSIATMLLFPGDGKIDEEYLLKTCVQDALVSRVKFNPEWLKTKTVQVEFLGFGQNLYEVGKPQFYYAVHIPDLTRAEYLSYLREHFNDKKSKVDVDRCIYVVKTDTLKFHTDDELKFERYYLTKKGKQKIKRVRPVMCEKSFICNMWHEQELERRKAK